MVGVNAFKETVDSTLFQGPVQTFQVDQDAVRAEQIKRLARLRATRDTNAVKDSLKALAEAAQDPTINLIPFILSAVKSYATLGEICGVLREIWGEYKETALEL